MSNAAIRLFARFHSVPHAWCNGGKDPHIPNLRNYTDLGNQLHAQTALSRLKEPPAPQKAGPISGSSRIDEFQIFGGIWYLTVFRVEIYTVINWVVPLPTVPSDPDWFHLLTSSDGYHSHFLCNRVKFLVMHNSNPENERTILLRNILHLLNYTASIARRRSG